MDGVLTIEGKKDKGKVTGKCYRKLIAHIHVKGLYKQTLIDTSTFSFGSAVLRLSVLEILILFNHYISYGNTLVVNKPVFNASADFLTSIQDIEATLKLNSESNLIVGSTNRRQTPAVKQAPLCTKRGAPWRPTSLSVLATTAVH